LAWETLYRDRTYSKKPIAEIDTENKKIMLYAPEALDYVKLGVIPDLTVKDLDVDSVYVMNLETAVDLLRRESDYEEFFRNAVFFNLHWAILKDTFCYVYFPVIPRENGTEFVICCNDLVIPINETIKNLKEAGVNPESLGIYPYSPMDKSIFEFTVKHKRPPKRNFNGVKLEFRGKTIEVNSKPSNLEVDKGKDDLDLNL